MLRRRSRHVHETKRRKRCRAPFSRPPQRRARGAAPRSPLPRLSAPFRPRPFCGGFFSSVGAPPAADCSFGRNFPAEVPHLSPQFFCSRPLPQRVFRNNRPLFSLPKPPRPRAAFPAAIVFAPRFSLHARVYAEVLFAGVVEKFKNILLYTHRKFGKMNIVLSPAGVFSQPAINRPRPFAFRSLLFRTNGTVVKDFTGTAFRSH